MAERAERAELTISSKRQITLPAAMLRELDVHPGDKLVMTLSNGGMTLMKRPESWADHYAGIAEGLYGKTDREVQAYIRESRGEWEPLEG